MDIQQDTYLEECSLRLAWDFACFSHKRWKGGNLPKSSASAYPF